MINNIEIILLLYLFIINIITFFMFYIDKRKAIKSKYRIPEKTLLYLSFLGGSIGGIIAMMIFHHKTQKIKFKYLMPTALTINIMAIALILKSLPIIW